MRDACVKRRDACARTGGREEHAGDLTVSRRMPAKGCDACVARVAREGHPDRREQCDACVNETRMQWPALHSGRPAFALEVLGAAAVYFAVADGASSCCGDVSLRHLPATGLALPFSMLRGRRLCLRSSWRVCCHVLNDTSVLARRHCDRQTPSEALSRRNLLQGVRGSACNAPLNDVASPFPAAACLSTISSPLWAATLDSRHRTVERVSSLLVTCAIGRIAIGHLVWLVCAVFVFVWADQARNRWRLTCLEAPLLLCPSALLGCRCLYDHGSGRSLPCYLMLPAVISGGRCAIGQHATADLVFVDGRNDCADSCRRCPS